MPTVIKKPSELKKSLFQLKKEGQKIGFVPTMGALHDGHKSLINKCIDDGHVTVVSIFVNPEQFNDPEDYNKYPNQIDHDLKICEEIGVDVVFAPSLKSVYTQKPQISFDFGYLGKILEAENRPGHFNGVGIVVSKLFHWVSPDVSYFGQKDLQQVRVIELLVRDLSFNTEIKMLPIYREADGLAFSSRNVRLSPKDRSNALMLSKSLKQAASSISKLKNPDEITFFNIEKEINEHLRQFNNIKVDYFAIRDADSLRAPVSNKDLALLVAAKVGNTRLIDNLIIAYP